MKIKHALWCLILAAASVAVADEKQNGNWWLPQLRPVKTVYMQGFLDGLVEEGSSWSNDVMMVSVIAPKDCKPTLTDMQKRLDEGSKRFNDITYGQLIDGLDSFYADYRNRLIWVGTATNLVVSSIRGTPADVWQQALEMARKASAD